jgi:hypothetical protein
VKRLETQPGQAAIWMVQNLRGRPLRVMGQIPVLGFGCCLGCVRSKEDS